MDSLPLKILHQFRLLEEWVRLDLVDGGDDFGSLEEFLNTALVEIGDTDSPNLASVEKFFHRSPGVGNWNISEHELAGFGVWELFIAGFEDNWPMDLMFLSAFGISGARHGGATR